MHRAIRCENAYVIRSAGAADQSGVLRCLSAAFEPYREAYTPQAFADTVLDPVTFRKRMQKMHILVAVCNFEIVGTIAGVCEGGEGHLRGTAVLPEWSGTGLAARLLLAIENCLLERGCRRITLDTTLPLKAAMRFYEKNGYVQSGKGFDFFGMPLLEYVKILSAHS